MAEISFRWHLEHISYLKFQRIIKCVALYSIVDHLPLKLISLKSFMLVQFRYFITLFICRFTWCTIQQMTSLEVMPLLSMNMNETCTVSIAQFFCQCRPSILPLISVLLYFNIHVCCNLKRI